MDAAKEGPREAVQRIITRLEQESDDCDWDDVFRGVAEDLGGIQDDLAIETLLKLLKSSDWDDFDYVGIPIIEALGKIGDERAVEPLCDFLNHNVTIVALGDIGSSKAVPALISLAEGIPLTDLDDEIVIVALAKIGDERAVPILKELLENDTANVKETAVMALDAILGTELDPFIDDYWGKREEPGGNW